MGSRHPEGEDLRGLRARSNVGSADSRQLPPAADLVVDCAVMRLVVPLCVSLAACSWSPESSPDAEAPPDGPDRSDAASRVDASMVEDRDGDGFMDGSDNCPDLANPAQADGDGDHFGDDCDCDAADPAVTGYIVLEDSLASDAGLFGAPAGFTGTHWTYDSAYLQTFLAAGGEDASFYFGNPVLENVRVDVRVASTEIADFGSNLRQLLLIARAVATGSTFRAHACGIEVVDGLTPRQKTSALGLSGTPQSVLTTVHERVDRDAVVEGEVLELHMILQGGTMTCTAVLDGSVVTTAGATDLPIEEGAVGFYTRETKARFQDVRICRLP